VTTEARVVPAPPLPVLPAPWRAETVQPDSPEVGLVHGWMHEPHVAPYWKQTWTLPQWSEKVRRHLAEDHTLPVLVWYDDEPVAYLQIYRVLRDRVLPYIEPHYQHHPHDLGAHIAIGERALTGKGYAIKLGSVLAPALFAADPLCRRIVGEPDASNLPAVRVAEALGFRRITDVVMPDKTAALMELRRPEGV
jgi:RimJ/RimL family protein N-acetyltransferase